MFIQGLLRCGLCPFNKAAVDFSRTLSITSMEDKRIEHGQSIIAQSTNEIFSFIKQERCDKLQLFEKCKSENWKGDIADKSLYESWKKTTNKIRSSLGAIYNYINKITSLL